MEALKKAIERTNDCIFRISFHSDKGWAYQMKRYSKSFKDNDIFKSMSRKGNCYVNSPIETSLVYSNKKCIMVKLIIVLKN